MPGGCNKCGGMLSNSHMDHISPDSYINGDVPQDQNTVLFRLPINSKIV